MKRLPTAILIFLSALHVAARTVTGTVTDASDGSPLPFCSLCGIGWELSALTDADGSFNLTLPDDPVKIEVSYVGYDTDTLSVGRTISMLKVQLQQASYALKEVVVSARESAGLVTSSKIDRNAMAHLQPSSFTDLLELLPGNISKNPSMGTANTISLRETGTIGATGAATVGNDYSISSLGTLFVVDGAPVGTDANMQSIGTASDAGSPDYARNVTNKGVDMRTISTDNIESVGIVRGIPSAEYGNLTSGMVNIRRIMKATPLAVRFKADGYSKLFSAGKGFSLPDHNHVINLDAGYLDSKTDPRDSYETYKRLNASARANCMWNIAAGVINWNIGADYTGSFDNAKTDPDLAYGKIDEYRSSYDRGALTMRLRATFTDFPLIDETELNVSASIENDVLERRKQVAPSRPSAAPASMEEGVHDGSFILGEYIADYRSEGRPFNAFLKASASGKVSAKCMDNRYKAGVEWTLAKNFGAGQVYDLMHPLSASWPSRPRRYSDIPALSTVSAYAMNTLALRTVVGNINLQAGLRLSALTSPDSRNYLTGRPYLDPRVNVLWQLPAIGKASPFAGAGYGLTTRMPTVDYLYPQPHYADMVQLNYYDVANPVENSRLNLRTYIDEAVNYSLRAARNCKWEVRAGVTVGTGRVSVTYFNEKLSSGYRYTTEYTRHSYTLYDASAIDAATLDGPPSLDNLPSVATSVLDGFRKVTNGSRIDKQGIEWQLETPRWRPVHTALTVTGAWFRTRYSNSQMLFSPVSEVIGNVAVSDRYVGLYDYDDGRINEQLNTNFMFDTQLPSLGLIFTTSLQCMWWVKTRAMIKDGIPTAYLSAADGQLHPYTTECLTDPMLAALVKTYNNAAFDTVKVPVAMYFNLKATKAIGRWLKVSVFVNRILDYLPDYKVNGLTIRRNTDAYFGMELNYSI